MANIKRAFFPVVYVLLFAGLPLGADSMDSALKKAVDGFAPYAQGKLVVSVGNFTYADKKIGSGFSRFLQEKLGLALSASARFEYFNRDRLDDLMAAAELSMSDIFDQKTVVKVNLKGVQAVIFGTFFDSGETVKVYLELMDVGTGTLKGKAELSIPKADIPTSVSVLPDNYNDALFVLNEIGEVQNARGGDFIIKAWTLRGDGGTYRDGERLVTNFYSNRDCFIKLYHIDVNGKVNLIFPNQYSRSNFIKAKTLYKIPDASQPFTFDLTEPYGTEFIKAIASTLPFTDNETAFVDLGLATRGIVTRGLNVNAKGFQVAETMLSYTIIK